MLIPVVLFAYARPHHLQKTLGSLRDNGVPLLYVFSDGPKTEEVRPHVEAVREIVRQIDWCEVVLCEREGNLGLGNSILAGVTEVFSQHESLLVYEDDLICVPGTYAYLVEALNHYRDDKKVMSVTGWTHPLITPSDVLDQPYFDGRAECLVWGTWRDRWQGMAQSAESLVQQCLAKKIDIYHYGADLPEMAKIEKVRNIWAVRFLYWHILNQKLCLRPPWSMVEHIGFDESATNAKDASWLKADPLKPAPPVPASWPVAQENPECAPLHRKVMGGQRSRIYRQAQKLYGWVIGRWR